MWYILEIHFIKIFLCIKVSELSLVHFPPTTSWMMRPSNPPQIVQSIEKHSTQDWIEPFKNNWSPQVLRWVPASGLQKAWSWIKILFTSLVTPPNVHTIVSTLVSVFLLLSIADDIQICWNLWMYHNEQFHDLPVIFQWPSKPVWSNFQQKNHCVKPMVS